MYKTLICITLISLAVVPGVADPFMTVDGEVVTHVKHCMFHEQIYESHFSLETACSFNLENPPQHEQHMNAVRETIPHDPECFGEENLSL